jgi:hypothetical protein
MMKQEKRLVLRVLGAWKELASEGALPLRRSFTPELFGSDWQHCFIVDATLGAALARFEQVGAALEVEGWSPAAGRAVAECPAASLLHAASAYLGRVVDKRVPISLGGAGENGGRAILYRSILLPLSSDGTRVDYLLGAANSRDAEPVGAGTALPA